MYLFDIVIVNWNSGQQLKECIYSLNSANTDNCKLNQIIIVDNASTDDSMGLLDNNQEKLKIIKNSKNLGFGKACNLGAKLCNGDFILFLNPDTLIFKDTFLNLFAHIGENDKEDIAIYGIQLLDKNKDIQKSCARLPKLSTFIIKTLGLNKLNPTLFKSYTMENWEHNDTREVDQVIGAFFMIKKEVFEKLNGFDERFFVYYEELDLSKRVKDLNLKTIYISTSQAYHKGGGVSENVKAKRLFYNLRSRIIYTFKNLGFFKGIFLLLFTFLIEPISRLFFLVLKRRYGEIPQTLKGFILLYKDTFNIIKLGLKHE